MKKLLPIILLFFLSFSFYGSDLRDKITSLEKEASEGNAEAMYHLSTLYEHGFDSIVADSILSFNLLRESAQKGYAPAQNYLGYRLFVLKRDSAEYWLTKAADNGDLKAQSNLAFLLLRPDSIIDEQERENRDKKAFVLLSESAEGGNAVAMSTLGDLYREGRGVEKDTLRATLLYLDAVSAGFSDAEPKLLKMNKDRYLTLCPDSALHEGLLAAKAGAHTVAFNLFSIASKGDIPKVYTLLGDSYSSAKGTDYNHELALKNYIEGAIKGDPSAQFILAEVLEIFPDILRQRDNIPGLEAYRELEKSAGNNPEDIDTPSYWYEKASAQGVTDAQEALRRLFY